MIRATLLMIALSLGGLAGCSSDEETTSSSDQLSAGSEAVPVVEDRRHLRAAAPDCTNWAVYFGTGSDQLDPEGQAQLTKLAECLEKGQIEDIRVIGSADPRGNEEENLALGRRRAETVRSYLIAQGCDRESIRVGSVGEEYASDRPAEWPAERRASVTRATTP